MIELKISGETADIFKSNLYQTFKALLPSLVQMEQKPAPETVVEETADEVKVEVPAETKVDEQKTEAPKTRTSRKKADEPKAEKQVDLEEAIAETEVVDPPIEEIRAALQSLAKSKGDDAVWTLLNNHKCKGATAVKDAGKGAVVVAECKALEAA